MPARSGIPPGSKIPPGSGVIARAARLVPFVRRSAWRREWEAEVVYAWQRMNKEGPPSRLAVLRLKIRTYTCVIDALWERKETMTMTTTGLFRDLRFALRSLSRYPAFTIIAVTTLALGIGANTAVFTLVDGVLLSPLPFDASEELISLEHLGRDGRDELPMSQGLYVLYREQVSSIDEVALYVGTTVNMVSDGEPARLAVQAVTPSFFPTLRVDAAVGRTFAEEEGAPDAERVVLLSDGLWKSNFGGDPGVIGQSVDINGEMRRIIGVMPRDLGFPTVRPACGCRSASTPTGRRWRRSALAALPGWRPGTRWRACRPSFRG